MKTFFKKSKNKGIALIVVLAVIALLTMETVHFFQSAEIEFELSYTQNEKLKAKFMAESALSFAYLLIEKSIEAEKLFQRYMKNKPGQVFIPLYDQFPLDTRMMRDLMESGGLSTLIGSSAPPQEESTQQESAEQELTGSLNEALGMIESLILENFLNFKGDFTLTITEQDTLIDLNRFYNLDSQSKQYDQHKKLLLAVLLRPEFGEVFEDQEKQALEVVHQIADWVDRNGMVNEFNGVRRGAEEQLYSDFEYEPKNGKMLTLSELKLLPAMNDALYQKLLAYVTVYNPSGKIHFCRAPREVLESLLYHYVNHAGCANGFDYDDDPDKWQELIDLALSYCPNVDQVTISLNQNLGLVANEHLATNPQNEEQSKDKKKRRRVTKKGGKSQAYGLSVAACEFQFRDLLKDYSEVYTIDAIGSIEHPLEDQEPLEIHLREIVGTKRGKISQWDTLFYKVIYN